MGIDRWLAVAGSATWLVSALPMAVRFVNGQVSPTILIVWAIAFPLFGLAYWLMCLDRPGIWQQRRVRRLLIVLQAGAGLAMTTTSPDVFPAGTLVVVAGQLDEFSPRVAAVWMVVQTLAIARIGFVQVNSVIALAIAGAFGGFQVFAFVMASLASREREARKQLTRAHTELLATRALLAENTRNQERLRISRDLHDTLGHHLTALSLQLDVASRLTDGKASEHVRQAHAITRLLLSEVRDVVSELRGRGGFDVGRAIRTLAAGSRTLAVHLDLPGVLEVDERAHDALVKCVQEVITNTTRHAEARNVWIVLTRADDGITLRAHDDGRGVKTVAPGNGLTGMRERFEALGGRVELRSSEGRGFEVHGFLPAPSTS
jgi:signal transduction histidine kinase